MSKNIPKTELLYANSIAIDELDISDGISLMIEEQKKAALEVKKASKSIIDSINAIYKHLSLSSSGRIVYVGAGTSGRIGVQDGVELFPTFSWPKNRLEFILAGGKSAMLKSIENAEDDVLEAVKITKKTLINSKDVVIGLAASGNTPFTCKVLEEAKRKNALTLAISNNPKGKLLNYGKFKIILDTKEEIISGSTRLKAGTSQKICLNVISSMVMIKFGRVKNGAMSHMVPTNKKLRERKLRLDKFFK